MDEREGLEVEPHALDRSELNAEEEVEGQQRTPDNEMVLYVDDRSTLIHCKCLRNIREITIVEVTIGDDELNALRTCRSLICISLLHCDGFDNLCVLAKLTTLEAISVYTRGSLRHIDSLSELPTLRRLTLSCNNIDERDILVLEEIATLEHIFFLRNDEVIYERGPDYIQSTIIADDNIRDLCKNRSLVKINFEGCKNLTDVALLAELQTLETVHFSQCSNLKDVGALGSLTRLKELDVRETAVKSYGIHGLSESRSLVKINLHGCIYLTNVTPLAAIQTLEEVSFTGCCILREIGVLGRLRKLKELFANKTAVNDDGIRGLSESRSLVKIHLEECTNVTDVTPISAIQTLEEVSFTGCCNLRDIGVLGGLRTLKILYANKIAVSDDGIRGLSASRSLMRVELGMCNCLTQMTPLACIKTLQCVYIHDSHNVRDISALGRLPRLKELYATGTAINNEGLHGLGRSRSLAVIELRGCQNLTDVSSLAGIQTLEWVNFTGCCMTQGIGDFGSLPHLKEFYMHDTALDDNDIRGLGESRSLVQIGFELCKNVTDVAPLAAIRTLVIVYVSGCCNLRDIGVLGRLPRLKELYADRTAINDDSIRGLNGCRSLVKIHLEECTNVTDVTPLVAIQTLEEVSFTGCCNLRDIGVLGGLRTLKILYANKIAVSDDGIRGLSESCSLVKIHLEECTNVTDVTPIAAIQTLEEVSFTGCCNLRDIGVLGGLRTLKILYANKIAVSDDGIRGLSESCSLVKIHLEECTNVTDVTPLVAIQTLEEVSFTGCCNLRDISVLGRLRTLKILYANKIFIIDDSIRGLIASRSLVKIHLEECTNVTDVTPIAAIQTLGEVSFTGCCNLRDIGVLGRLRKLKELFANKISVSDDGIRGLSESRSLVKIHLEECTNVTDVTPIAAIQTLEEVSFTGCCILREIGVLGRLRKLKILYANKIAVSDDGIRGLSESRSLVKIHLEEINNLTDVTPIAAIQTLEEVSFTGCCILRDIGVLGRLRKLKILYANKIAVSDDGIRGLSASRSLMRVELGMCNCLTQMTPLACIKTLQCVYIHDSHNVRDISALGRLPRLKELYATGTAINNEGLHGLGRSRSLAVIELRGCQNLTDVSSLAGIQTLEWVNFTGCCMTQGIGDFGSLPHLKEFYMHDTALDDNDIRGLGESRSLVQIGFELCKNVTDVAPLAAIRTLVIVYVSGCCNLRDIGVLGRLPRLKELYADRTAINDDSIRGLNGCRSLVKIHLEECTNVTDVTPLVAIQTLEEVSFTGCCILREIGVLGRLRKLKELFANKTAVSDDGIRGLSESRSLVKIHLEEINNLTDVTPIAAIQTLEEVSFTGCCILREIGVLGRLRKLKILYANKIAVSDDGIRGLSESCSLVKIHLEECTNVTDVTPIAAIQTLEEVSFTGCCNLRDISVLGRLRTLKILYANKTFIIDDSIRGLIASRSLVKIHLEECTNVTDVTPLVAIQTLEEVSFTGCCNLRDIGVLGRLRKLKELFANKISVSDDGIRGLSESRSLVKIHLEECTNVTDVTPLAAIQTLEEVSFTGCCILREIGVLGRLRKLKILYANKIAVSDDGIRGLSESRSLVKIHLEEINNLTDVTPIAAIQTLEEVSFTGCCILRDIGVLGRLRKLKILYANKIAVSDDGIRGLSASRSLMRVELGMCNCLTQMTPLACIKTLQCVYIHDSHNVRDISALGRLPRLKELYATGTAINNEGLHGLGRSRSLAVIELRGCQNLTDVSSLAGIQKLEHLDLNNVHMNGVGPLGGLPMLRVFFAKCSAINNEDLCGLSESRSLVKINLERCNNLTDVTPLAAIQTLEWVNLSYCFNLKNTSFFGRLPYLRELQLRETAINDDSIRGLSESRSLVKINLERCKNLTDVSSLATIKTLKEVSIVYCDNVIHVGTLRGLRGQKGYYCPSVNDIVDDDAVDYDDDDDLSGDS